MKKNEGINEIDAKKYWQSFERLAVEVVKVEIKEIFNVSNLDVCEKKDIPQTRDHGMEKKLIVRCYTGNGLVWIEQPIEYIK